jgi:hypothetical protein
MGSLADFDGAEWVGSAELWRDPLGDDVVRSECRASFAANVLKYTWSHDGADHEGRVELQVSGAEFIDSWHQPESMECWSVANANGLFQVQGSYGPDGEWGWRIALSFREPTGELVLQMTNIAPWGEEARAVRMTFRRA